MMAGLVIVPANLRVKFRVALDGIFVGVMDLVNLPW
jgi:hypothetical protein